MSRRWIGLAAILLAAAVLVIVGLRDWHHRQIFPATDDAYLGGDVTSVAARLPGTLVAVAVSGNQAVSAGQVIARLDTTDYAVALAKQKAALAAAEAAVTLDEARLAAAQAEVDAAAAQLALARADRDRFTALADNGSGSRRDAEQAAAACRVAEARLTAARKQLAAAEAAVTAGRRRVAKARTGVRKAELDLSYCTITAPCDGVVTDLHARPGQVVAPGQTLGRIAQLTPGHVWIDANFKETQLRRIRPGQPATFRIDVDRRRTFTGRVESIAPGSGAAFALLPPENATGNWVKVVQRVPVRIAVDPNELPPACLRLGLSCEVTVDTRDREE